MSYNSSSDVWKIIFLCGNNLRFLSSGGLQRKKGYSTEAVCKFAKYTQHELKYLLLNSQVQAKQSSHLLNIQFSEVKFP